ncbi:MAG: GTPase [Promethearchaeota archaeon]
MAEKNINKEQMVSIEILESTYKLLLSRKREAESIDEALTKLLLKEDMENITRRVLFIGPPASGKSTLRKIFFEETDPDNIMENPLEPTRGIENYVYNWLDIDVGIADSSGQEIEKWFGLEQEYAFGELDAVIFVFDVSRYEPDKDFILADIAETILTKRTHSNINAKIYIFAHKKDLIEEGARHKNFNRIKIDIHEYLKQKEILDSDTDPNEVMEIFNTSIKGELVLSVIKAMRTILYPFSQTLKRAVIPYAMRK